MKNHEVLYLTSQAPGRPKAVEIPSGDRSRTLASEGLS